jgi:uncharacterized membrane protein YhaH (DUF805 family)
MLEFLRQRYVIALIVFIAVYVYLALAFLKIGKKAGLEENAAGLSWIPFFGPIVVTYLVSGMHWWPWIVISIGMMILLVLVNIGVFSFFLGTIFYGIVGVFLLLGTIIYWMWKTFAAVGKPGWWALIAPIGVIGGLISLASPIVGGIINLIAGIAFLVLLGIAAGSSGGQEVKPIVKPAGKPMAKQPMKPMKK